MNIKKFLFYALILAVVASICAVPVFAAQVQDQTLAAAGESQSGEEPADTESDSTGAKAVAAAVAVGLAAAGGALGMGMAVSKSAEGISRQPEAEGKIRTTMMLGLVFIETAIIYALIVAILIIFVL